MAERWIRLCVTQIVVGRFRFADDDVGGAGRDQQDVVVTCETIQHPSNPSMAQGQHEKVGCSKRRTRLEVVLVVDAADRIARRVVAAALAAHVLLGRRAQHQVASHRLVHATAMTIRKSTEPH